MKANIKLFIDELVLHGLPGWQCDDIAAAVEAELQRLLDEGGLLNSLAAGGALAEVQVGGLRVAAGAKPGDVGAQIAESIYNSLAGSRDTSGAPERSKG